MKKVKGARTNGYFPNKMQKIVFQIAFGRAIKGGSSIMRRKTNYQSPVLQVKLLKTRDVFTESSEQPKNEDDDGRWSGVHNP